MTVVTVSSEEDHQFLFFILIKVSKPDQFQYCTIQTKQIKFKTTQFTQKCIHIHKVESEKTDLERKTEKPNEAIMDEEVEGVVVAVVGELVGGKNIHHDHDTVCICMNILMTQKIMSTYRYI
ncbi:hypothetical protein S83_043339 [Arachis hypogaea]